MYIATTNAKGDLVIEAEATAKGKLYVYLGNQGTVTDNWTKSSFTVKTFDLEKDKLKKCEIKGQDTNKDIWILFLPESSNVYGILKIKSLVIKVDI